MILYHGGLSIIKTPDVTIGRQKVDFGAIDTYIEQIEKGRTTEYTKNALIAELKFSRQNSQYAFKTEKSLISLKFIRAEEI